MGGPWSMNNIKVTVLTKTSNPNMTSLIILADRNIIIISHFSCIQFPLCPPSQHLLHPLLSPHNILSYPSTSPSTFIISTYTNKYIVMLDQSMLNNEPSIKRNDVCVEILFGQYVPEKIKYS